MLEEVVEGDYSSLCKFFRANISYMAFKLSTLDTTSEAAQQLRHRVANSVAEFATQARHLADHALSRATGIRQVGVPVEPNDTEFWKAANLNRALCGLSAWFRRIMGQALSILHCLELTLFLIKYCHHVLVAKPRSCLP